MADSNRRKANRWSGDRRGKTERRAEADRRRKKHRRKADVKSDRPERRDTRERRNLPRRGADRRTEAGWQPVPIEQALLMDYQPEQSLLAAAIDARRHAQAHYSGFKVGAALESSDGRVITGCNIENAK